MKRDTIFYKLFQQSPTAIFELLPNAPANASSYRFDSVAVKEPKFEIDGVFLPPEDEKGIVFFCEVQFQEDKKLCERAFAEAFLYFYRNRDRFSDWEIILIYPNRNTEQKDLHPYRNLINSDQVHRVYLNELGDIRQLPTWIALMVLATLSKSKAPEEARYLLSRSEQEVSPPERRVIMEVVASIISYRFEQLSRQEIEKMLDITLKGTRVYRDISKETLVRTVSRQLKKRFGDLASDTQIDIEQLSLPALEDLSDALLDFKNQVDLQTWLTSQKSRQVLSPDAES